MDLCLVCCKDTVKKGFTFLMIMIQNQSDDAGTLPQLYLCRIVWCPYGQVRGWWTVQHQSHLTVRHVSTVGLYPLLYSHTHTHTTWTLSAPVSGWLSPGLFLPLSVPPWNERDHPATVQYGRACLSLASCNLLCSVFCQCATWIFMKQCCSQLRCS